MYCTSQFLVVTFFSKAVNPSVVINMSRAQHSSMKVIHCGSRRDIDIDSGTERNEMFPVQALSI